MAKDTSQATATEPVSEPEIAAEEKIADIGVGATALTTKVSETGLGTSPVKSEMERMMEEMQQIDAAINENIEQGEIQVARISIAQPGTPEVASGQDGWKAGMLFDSMNREVITVNGKPPWLLAKGIPADELQSRPFLPVVCIFRLPSEYVKWPTKDERESGIRKFHWKDLDAMSPRVREGMWKPKGTWAGTGAPPVTEHLNVLMLGLNPDGSIKTNLLIDSFSRTSFRSGQKLVTSLNQHRMNKLPWWGRVYYLFTDSKTEEGNTYYRMQFAVGPKLLEYGDSVLAQETFKACFDNAKALADKQNGRALQELMVNAAAFAEDDVSDVGGGDGGFHDGSGTSTDGDPDF